MDIAAPPQQATVTLLFTNIEASTRLWEQQPEAMQHALACHDALLRDAIEAHGGQVADWLRSQRPGKQ
jgi:class 3 adenylate cyclase